MVLAYIAIRALQVSVKDSGIQERMFLTHANTYSKKNDTLLYLTIIILLFHNIQQKLYKYKSISLLR